MDSLIFPVLSWLDDKLGIDDENGGIILECILEHGYPVEWDVDDEGVCTNIKRTDDFGVIYDKYVAGGAHCED